MRMDSGNGFGGRVKNLGVFLLIVAVYVLVMSVSGIGCPVRWVTGISCPGCGMSRALFSLLRLDFGDAFRYHPLIFPVILFVPYYFLGSDDPPRKGKIKKILLVVLAVLAVFLWIFRIFHEDSVVRIDPSSGIVIKCLKAVTIQPAELLRKAYSSGFLMCWNVF